MTKRLAGLIAVLMAVGVCTAHADVRLPKVFSDHAVLQRILPLVVWGSAEPGEKIKVAVGGQTASTSAGANGVWRVTLKPLKGPGPLEMVVTGKNTVTVKDLLVGDVWLCSGQSNMEWSLRNTDTGHQTTAAASNSMIRLLHVTAGQSGQPQTDIGNTWNVCNPQTVGNFSAVAYFFGRAIQEEVGIPIGLIANAWGGTAIEPWTSPDAWKGIEELARLNPNPSGHGHIYNGRVAPLAPYGIRGAIWYQGETNGGDDDIYYHKMRGLIGCWRQAWGVYSDKRAGKGGKPSEYEFPFYFVQLANFQGANDNPAGGDGWAKIRMAQFRAMTIPKTGMATIIDIGEPGDIHPRNKEDVGKRLAFWALAKDYGKSRLVYSGPLYKSMKAQGSKVHIAFDCAGSGLMIGRKEGHGPAVEAKAVGGEAPKLKRFAVAGEDKKWFWADAVIDGSTVVVSSTNVPSPAAVRYAFSMNPEGCNLYNKEGLPASPFRTDTW